MPISDVDRLRRRLLFDTVADLYDRFRPGYPLELWADLATMIGPTATVLEVACGAGQATEGLVGLGWDVTAVELGPALAAHARRRAPGATVEVASFEEWDARGRRFDLVLSASAWHWLDPERKWTKAADLLVPGGKLALLGNIVIRVDGEPEVYAETADLHQRLFPGHPGWGHPPTEDELRAEPNLAWEESSPSFSEPEIRWYPHVAWFDGDGFANHLRTTSLYQDLDSGPREALLSGIAEYIRTRMNDRVARHYLATLTIAQPVV